MKHVLLPPFAPVLLESMRAVGYDPAAAVADILDNSITAGARRIQIRFDPGPTTALAICDDGTGMTLGELNDAMRHGSRSPNDTREAKDLGRFGLGLKTASMSQCRRLTVITRRNGVTSAMVWDLDDVAEAKDWTAGVLEDHEIGLTPFFTELLAPQSTGTLVVWEKLDRLAADNPDDGSVLSDRMGRVGDHLAVVFHRFLSDKPPLRIEINGSPVEGVDPFLEDSGSVAGPPESFYVEDHRVALRAFTLPHISRLTKAHIDRAGGEDGLRRLQGFYVYRERRLIVWGTWFRLARQEELTKLTRVRVDVPNSLDHLWSLDIKKSTAAPPAAIRQRLKDLVPKLAQQSRHTNAFRGRVSNSTKFVPLWNRVEDRDGGIHYAVNAEHQAVSTFRDSLPEEVVGAFGTLLRALAAAFPVEALYNDRANDRMGYRREKAADPEAVELLEETARLILSAVSDPAERKRLLNALPGIEPFSLHPDLTAKLLKRLS